MTAQALTGLLAERVMKWTAAPNRFMLGHRKWIANWRFQPCKNLADAFQLLDAASGSLLREFGNKKIGICFSVICLELCRITQAYRVIRNGGENSAAIALARKGFLVSAFLG